MKDWARIARSLAAYDRFRYSGAYELAARARRTPYAATLASDRQFFRRLFAQYEISRVFDVGANTGDRTRVFAEFAQSVICVEPDPDLVRILTLRFRGRRSVFVESVAVSDSDGYANLFRKNYSGFNTLSRKWSDAAAELGVAEIDAIPVCLVTLDNLISRHGTPHYIKIDVEGHELPAIRGLTASIPAISFEANLPAFMGETRQIVHTLMQRHPETRFNMRVGDEETFRLRTVVLGGELLATLSTAGALTCDIFAFRNLS